MIDKLQLLHPEIALFIGSCVMLILGLSKARAIRTLCAPITGVFLAAAIILAIPAFSVYI